MIKITLKKREINFLNAFIKQGKKNARAITRARILLLAHKKEKDVNLQKLLSVGRSTIWRVKNNYLDKGIYLYLKREVIYKSFAIYK